MVAIKLRFPPHHTDPLARTTTWGTGVNDGAGDGRLQTAGLINSVSLWENKKV